MITQTDDQSPSSTMEDVAASVQDEVVDLNRKFYTWISSSWEMCPHFCWNGAAQEYINQLNRILENGSRGGSASHAHESRQRAPRIAAALQSPETAGRVPLAAATAAPPVSTQSLSPTTTTTAPLPAPSTSPILPSSTAAPRSRKRGAQGEHPDDPHAQTAARPSFSFGPSASAATTKPKPAASPFKVSTPAPADTIAPPVPAPPLFSSFGTASTKPAATSSSPTVGGHSSGPASSKPFGAASTAPSFGKPSAIAAPLFGAMASSSAAASQPASSPGFSFKPPAAAAADPKSPTLPLFSSIGKSGASAASSAAAPGAFSAGFSFSQPAAAKPAPVISFGAPSSGTATAPASSAAFSFSSPAAGGFGSAGFGNGGTPNFNFGGATAAAAPGAEANGSGTAADGDEEPQEKAEKVEIKGDDKTDIVFSGKASFRSKNESGWSDPIVGLLTLRRDKASGRHWLQINSETKGSIFVYASIPSAAKFRTPDGKASVNIIVNIFQYPPGQEPKKMGDDGKGGKKQLDEREENSTTTKSVMLKTKSSDLQPLVDALKTFGCQPL